MVNTAVNIGGIFLKNPVIAASGTFGYGLEFAPFVDVSKLGGLVVKGLSLKPYPGNPPPRIIETAGGMLNSIGLQNIGVKAFVKEKLPLLRTHEVAVIANIFGHTIGEYIRVARVLSEAEGVAGLEINISCPNIKKGGMAFGKEPKQAGFLIKRIRKATALPLMVKLTPQASDIGEVAKRVEGEGADSISLVNTFLGMAIDVDTARPLLATVTGGLSGPAIKPLALRMVWEVAQKVSLPVVGIGGIMSARDALEFIIAGAHAVQIGTANFISPTVCLEVIHGIEEYLAAKQIDDIGNLVGSVKLST